MVKTKNDITSLIFQNKSQIHKYGAKSIGLFGSFASGKQNDESDIDLIVEFEKEKKTFHNFINLTYFLEDLFQRRVELITPESISKYIKPHILKNTDYVSISI